MRTSATVLQFLFAVLRIVFLFPHWHSSVAALPSANTLPSADTLRPAPACCAAQPLQKMTKKKSPTLESGKSPMPLSRQPPVTSTRRTLAPVLPSRRKRGEHFRRVSSCLVRVIIRALCIRFCELRSNV